MSNLDIVAELAHPPLIIKHLLPYVIIICIIDKLNYPLDSRIKGFLIEVRKPQPPSTPTTTSVAAEFDYDITPSSILGECVYPLILTTTLLRSTFV